LNLSFPFKKEDIFLIIIFLGEIVIKVMDIIFVMEDGFGMMNRKMNGGGENREVMGVCRLLRGHSNMAY
jgi:hypothetical protein